MIKRALLSLLLCGISSIGASGQKTCGSNSTNLSCQIPVITTAAYPGTIGNPAAAFSSSFATQLGQLPLLSSGAGVVLTLDRTLGVYVASENLGPILTDRAQTIGRHKILLAFAFQKFVFNSIDGTNLNNVPFVFAAVQPRQGEPTPTVNGCTSTAEIICLAQKDRVSMNVNQYVALATFGLNSRTDISVVLPFERVALGVYSNGNQYFISASGMAETPNPAPFTSYAPGSASGVGDLYVNVKRLIWSGSDEKTHLSAGLLVRFPTGDALNYLGSGAYGFDPYAVFAYQARRISPHVRLGYQFNTSTVLVPTFNSSGTFTGYSNLPGGFQYDFGADALLFKKIPTTVAGDFLGNYIVNAPVLVPGSVGIPAYNTSAPTLITRTNSYNSAQLSIGLKVKPWRNLILYGNALFQLNNVGLRSEPVPLVGVSYTF
jgi:Putative MetA-pathway of phenol degradation